MSERGEQRPWRAALEPARTWWAARAGRERTMLLSMFVVLGLFALWMLALRPALATIANARTQIDTLELQLQAMQRQASEAKALRATAPVAPAQAAAALKAATDRLGEQGRLMLQGERAVLTLSGASSAQLRGWLAEARSGARARAVEANLVRSGTGLNGTLVVSISATP